MEEVKHQWRELGVRLKVPYDTLEAIQTNPGNDSVVTQFNNMLWHWIKNGKEDTRTWGFFAKAVEKSGQKALANKIRRRKEYEHESKGISIYIVRSGILSCIYNLRT